MPGDYPPLLGLICPSAIWEVLRKTRFGIFGSNTQDIISAVIVMCGQYFIPGYAEVKERKRTEKETLNETETGIHTKKNHKEI